MLHIDKRKLARKSANAFTLDQYLYYPRGHDTMLFIYKTHASTQFSDNILKIRVISRRGCSYTKAAMNAWQRQTQKFH